MAHIILVDTTANYITESVKRGTYVNRKVIDINSKASDKDKKVSLLVDVQEKIRQGKGKGYER